ncbi:MAG: SLC13 family permease [Candidatus Bathyarchaeia archaeon]
MVKVGAKLEHVHASVTRVRHINGLYFAAALAAVGAVFQAVGSTSDQMVSVLVFAATVAGTLLYWRFRLAFAIGGAGLLLLLGILSLNLMVGYMSVDVVAFLVSMMVIVESVEHTGLFRYLTCQLVRRIRYRPERLIVAFMALGAVTGAVIDEVTAVLLLGVMILNLCETWRVNPKPYLVSAVFAINIGSAATVLGNPVGVIIAFKALLSFEDFLRWATPVSTIALVAAMSLVLLLFRKDLREDAERIKVTLRDGDPLVVNGGVLSHDRGKLKRVTAVFVTVLVLVALHHRLELLLGLSKNVLLLGIPLLGAAFTLVFEKDDARQLVESGVDWWTLLFFMFLFAITATLQDTGVTQLVAEGVVNLSAGNEMVLLSLLTWPVMLLSGTIDNVPLLIPLIHVIFRIEETGVSVYPLWWIVLFANNFGGNLTMVGSTANVVALGLLEKRGKSSIGLLEWLKIGLVVTVATVGLAQVMVYLMQPRPLT